MKLDENEDMKINHESKKQKKRGKEENFGGKM